MTASAAAGSVDSGVSVAGGEAPAAPVRVLVTGAAGKLGSATCEALVARGIDVRATDRRYRRGLPVRLEVGDLGEEGFVYRMVEGVDAVVHLGNHPNPFAGPSPQRLLAENMAMNANVFYAAEDAGVGQLVFSSSIQVFLHSEGGMREPPYFVPYLPLDGAAPRNPGPNAYAMSKEFGERMLEELTSERPTLGATAVRFPMLVTEHWLQHVRRGVMPPWGLNYPDVLTYLDLRDAGAFVAAVLAHPRTGYRQYFPAQTWRLRGLSPADIVRRWYPDAPLRRPLEALEALVDLSAISAELGWRPEHGVEVELG